MSSHAAVVKVKVTPRTSTSREIHRLDFRLPGTAPNLTQATDTSTSVVVGRPSHYCSTPTLPAYVDPFERPREDHAAQAAQNPGKKTLTNKEASFRAR